MVKGRGLWLQAQTMFVKGILQWRVLASLLLLVSISMTFGYGPPFNIPGNVHPLENFIKILGNAFYPTLCLLLLLSDAPFTDANEGLILLRTGRWRWLRMRLAYLAGMIVLFLLFVIILSVLLSLPYIQWDAASLSTDFFLQATPYELTSMPPGPSFAYTFLAAWLGMAFYSLLLFAANLRISRGVGTAISMGVCALLHNLAFFLGGTSLFARFPMIEFINPLRHVDVMQHNFSSPYEPSPLFPTFGQSLLYLGILVLIMLGVVIGQTRNISFRFHTSRPGGD